MPDARSKTYAGVPKSPMAGKGALRHSTKSRTATQSAASHDVNDFDRAGYPGKRHIDVDPHQVIGTYQRLGEALKRTSSFRKVAEEIGKIAELAETTVTEEAGDWFDQHTIKRNMKELKNHAGEFSKISEELDSLHQRATALYDDVGNVLSRYFEIVEPKTDDAEILTEPEVEDDEYSEPVKKEQGLKNFGGKKAQPFTSDDPRAEAGRKEWDARDGEDEVEEGGVPPARARSRRLEPRERLTHAREMLKKAQDAKTRQYWQNVINTTQKLLSGKANEIKEGDFFTRAGAKRGRADIEKQIRRLQHQISWNNIDARAQARKTGQPSDPAKTREKNKALSDKIANLRQQLALVTRESAVPMTKAFARQAIRTPAAFSRTNAGMTRNQAKAILKKEGAKTVKEAKRALTKEHLRKITKNK